eukprot:12790851-Ditylum_brightwellii.AAC.1
MLKALRNGVGAMASVLKRLLQPKKKISKKYAIIDPHERVEDLLVVSRGQRKVKTRLQDVVFFCHNNFPNDMLYVSEQFFKVLKEGPEEEFFSQELRTPTPNVEENTTEEEQESRGEENIR